MWDMDDITVTCNNNRGIIQAEYSVNQRSGNDNLPKCEGIRSEHCESIQNQCTPKEGVKLFTDTTFIGDIGWSSDQRHYRGHWGCLNTPLVMTHQWVVLVIKLAMDTPHCNHHCFTVETGIFFPWYRMNKLLLCLY